MKLFHEAPNNLFEDIQEITDGDYALCHLLEENERYVDLFVRAREKGREIILDNSVFELGQSVGATILAKWCHVIQPDWVILPDVFHSASMTITNMHEFLLRHPIPSRTKTIGVVQALHYEEAVVCYKELVGTVDMVAFNMKLGHWLWETENNLDAWKGRIKVLDRMESEGIIKHDKPHHLLGCTLPKELRQHGHRKYIHSMDTSQPVMWGLSVGKYEHAEECSYKLPGKIYNYINRDCIPTEREDVLHNIRKFKEYVQEVS